MDPYRVILLPGSVLPAGPAYGRLLEVLGPAVDAVAKDLELYATDTPPPDWSLDTEVDGVLREADLRGWDTFHLLGYSGGGAAALALAARHTERLRSLALLEPAWAGNWDWSLRTPGCGSATGTLTGCRRTNSCRPSPGCR
ncbi:alpha/beta fold hydrolase [Pseudarthrobacter phenanthrenivorans]|uniref:alpha/beta fold hydrolase n=1 Tax=Pseudarthrobacter phenanthrenivorans TaxID=361575 RepID=UPI002F35398A